MQVFDQQTLLKKFAGFTVKADPFFLKETGFLANQTTLKLGEYNLITIPASMTFEDAKLLAVLTPNEVNLFSSYTTSTNTLIYSFSSSENDDVARFHIKVNLLGIVPLPERKNVCLVSVKYKSVPADLIQILGAFWEAQEDRKAAWDKYAQETITLNPSIAELLGFNNYAEILDGSAKLKVKLIAFHAQEARLGLPAGADLAGKTPLFLKFYFRSSQFAVEGELLPEGVFKLQFSNDLIGIIENYYFRLSVIQKKRSQHGAGA